MAVGTAERGGRRDGTRAATSAGGVTRRALLLGSLLLVALAPAVFAGCILRDAGSVTNGAPAAVPVVIVFALTALMALPRFRRAGISRREILTVYAMALVAGPLLSPHVLYFVLPKVVLYYHAARANAVWEHTVPPLIPTWWAPSRVDAIEGFMFGEASVPWGLWVGPLAAWGSFLVALFGACACLLVLLRQQWIVNERLAFPLAQVPLEMVREEEGGERPRLPGSRLFWLGLGLGFGLKFWNGLAALLPALPRLPFEWTTLMLWQKEGPLAGVGDIIVDIQPTLLGLVYLLPTELSFSVLFFWGLRLAVHCLMVGLGATPQKPESWGSGFPDPYDTGAGAVMALGLWSLWVARRHLLRALSLTLDARAEDPDPSAPLPYRWALLGLALCLGWLTAFCLLSGCRLVFAGALLAILVGGYVVFARIQAETALQPVVADQASWLTALTGTRALRPRELLLLTTLRWAWFPVPNMVFPATVLNALQSLKVAHVSQLNGRRLGAAVALGFAVALAAGSLVFLRGTYHYGYFGTATGAAWYWPSLQSRMDAGSLTEAIASPRGPGLEALAYMAGGAAICLLLGAMRLRFWWWPFHPVGFVVAMGWGIPWECFAFLAAWVAKTLVVRYGGLRLYRKTVPLAIGLIVGQVLNDSLWVVVTALGGR